MKLLSKNTTLQFLSFFDSSDQCSIYEQLNKRAIKI